MTKKIKLKRITVPIDKLVTMAEMGLGAVRPLNKEKRGWINKLKKQSEPFDPILVTPIKDSGYYLLTDGWHRVQAAKAMKEKEISMKEEEIAILNSKRNIQISSSYSEKSPDLIVDAIGKFISNLPDIYFEAKKQARREQQIRNEERNKAKRRELLRSLNERN